MAPSTSHHPGPTVDRLLTDDAIAFIADLERRFRPRRSDLLEARRERQAGIKAGDRPDFVPSTTAVRAGTWEIAEPPKDLLDRRVELAGGADRAGVVSGLSAGADVYLADFEDATAPAWTNIVDGHDAVRLALQQALPTPAVTDTVVVVRPRGWHLDEAHFDVDGAPISAALFDVGLALFHGAREALDHGSGPYFSLPKLQNHFEARLWNDVFCHAQDRLGIERGSIKATVVIESVLAAFEMDEILYELREHSIGLTAGRWDYVASMIRTFGHDPSFVLGDRADLDPHTGFLRACTDLLIATCHRRGAHAIGPITTVVPDGDDRTELLERVSATKTAEALAGFDGTRVAHPDLVTVAAMSFDEVLGERPNQIRRQRPDVAVVADDLISTSGSSGVITERGLRTEVAVLTRYLLGWFHGRGVLVYDQVSDGTATAEVSRMQLWHWLHHGCTTSDGAPIDATRLRGLVAEELDAAVTDESLTAVDRQRVIDVLDGVLFADEPVDFLTPYAYPILCAALA